MLSGCSGNTEAQNSTVRTLSVSRVYLTAIHQSDWKFPSHWSYSCEQGSVYKLARASVKGAVGVPSRFPFLLLRLQASALRTGGCPWSLVYWPCLSWRYLRSYAPPHHLGAARSQRLLTDRSAKCQAPCLKTQQIMVQFTLQSFPRDQAELDFSWNHVFAYLFSLPYRAYLTPF